MVRPHKPRRVGHRPDALFYKPAGVPVTKLKHVELSLDELEALRLTDVEFLDQASAAERMNVSRATVGRILLSAREKVATALNFSMAITIGAKDANVEFYNGCPNCSRQRRCGQTKEETTNENSNQQ